MAAMDDATGNEKLIQSYELDVARINRIIQKIRDGTVLEMPSRLEEDPTTGQPIIDPMTGQTLSVPGWMPDIQDNSVVWMAQLSDWMKTEEYEQASPPQQEIARHMLQGMQQLEAQKAAQAQEAQALQAAQLGMDSASKEKRQTPLPSQRRPDGMGSKSRNPGQPGQ
jgi:hypothetical protein